MCPTKGALDSAVAVDNDPVTRDGAAWFEIQPVVDNNGNITGAHFTDQGYVAVAGEFPVYPAITQTFEGTTGISFSITSPTLNPSTGYPWRCTPLRRQASQCRASRNHPTRPSIHWLRATTDIPQTRAGG